MNVLLPAALGAPPLTSSCPMPVPPAVRPLRVCEPNRFSVAPLATSSAPPMVPELLSESVPALTLSSPGAVLLNTETSVVPVPDLV